MPSAGTVLETATSRTSAGSRSESSAACAMAARTSARPAATSASPTGSLAVGCPIPSVAGAVCPVIASSIACLS